MIEFASGQITGRRSAQEDALGIMPLGANLSASEPVEVPATSGPVSATASLGSGLIMVVADGMGGHVGGRVASSVCVEAFLSTVSASSEQWNERLEAGLLAANEALRHEAESQPELAGMGSTLVGAVVSEAGVGWISIGDSALYLHQAGSLTRLNEDHSFGAYLDQQAREGLMTSEAAQKDRRRNHLFYALLGGELDHYERFSGFRGLSAGDCVLLASDGLKTLDDGRLAGLIAAHAAEPLADMVAAILQSVEQEDRERQDNVSLIVARRCSDPRPSDPHMIARDAPTAPPAEQNDPPNSGSGGDALAVPVTRHTRSPRLAILAIAVIAVIAGLAVGYFGYR